MPGRDDDYDKRITMSSTYVPPLPKDWGKPPRRWPKQLAISIGLIAASLIGGYFGLEHWLGRDSRLPRIWRVSDYHPKALTRLVAESGERIGEIVGERRTVLPSVPRVVRDAVVQAREPDFFDRAPLGRMDFVRAMIDRARGEPEPPSITLSLARSLTRELRDGELVKLAKQWMVALRLERRLSREEVLHLYMNEVSFGRGVFGVEEGARALARLSAAQLDAKQAAQLAARAESDAPLALAPTPTLAPEHAALVAEQLTARFDADGLARLGATVTTTCDLSLTQKIHELLRQKKIVASVVVQRSSSHEVSVLAGSAEPRPIGPMRAPLLLAAALRSQRFTAATVLDRESGERLRGLAQRSPVRAADLLVDRGLALPAILDLAQNAGFSHELDGNSLSSGRARATPLAVSSMLATFASGGVRRQPQLIRAISGEPEADALRATFAVSSPEEAYLVASLLSLARVSRPAAGVSAPGGNDAWFGAFTPDLAVTVHVDGADRPRARADELERLASSLGLAVLAAAHQGLPARPFRRPPTLVRRIEDGREEWFIPGTAPSPP